jgi:hypothetical protein
VMCVFLFPEYILHKASARREIKERGLRLKKRPSPSSFTQ